MNRRSFFPPRAPRKPATARDPRVLDPSDETIDGPAAREAIREAEAWRPKAILLRLGPAPNLALYGPQALMVLALLEGPQALDGLTDRLALRLGQIAPRTHAQAEDRALVAYQARFKALEAEQKSLLKSLQNTRLRLQHDRLGRAPEGGLRWMDLWRIRDAIACVLLSEALSAKPSPTGVAQVLKVHARRPTASELAANQAALGLKSLSHRLQNAESLGRVVIADLEGRLLYDPEPQEKRDG